MSVLLGNTKKPKLNDDKAFSNGVGLGRSKLTLGYAESPDLDITPGQAEKPDIRSGNVGVSMGINLSTDTSRLEVCFGGFNPTAMHTNGDATEVVERAEAFRNERIKSNVRLAEIEAMRASEKRVWIDEQGTEWTYVLLDGVTVRIEKCVCSVAALCVPEQIEGLPVVALAADACAYLNHLEEVRCPDSLITIGFCAFRACKSLKKAVLPKSLSSYDSSWFRSCNRLEDLTLSGCLEQIGSNVFDNPSLRVLRVGEGTSSVAPGAFGKSRLERVEVVEDNPFMDSDGLALYHKGFVRMLALAVPVESYCVADGCRAIARKAFSGFECLKSVELSPTIELIEGFAFWRTSISTFVGPAALRVVEEKAFFNCRCLEQATFECDLLELGVNVFTGTALNALLLPSTIERLGNPLAEGAKLIYAGPEATFGIAAGGNVLSLDEHGGLYRRQGDRKVFEALLDPRAERYEIAEGTDSIADHAFASHHEVVEVHLPEGLSEIGEGAFKDCRKLKSLNVPESVRCICDEAFLDTALESVYLPSGLELLGKNALVTRGAHYSASMRQARVSPSLRAIEIGEGNERFFMRDGLLLEKAGTGGTLRLLLCTGSHDVVRIPPEVNDVAPYALNNVKGIRELYLSDRIVVVGIRGLAVDGFVELIHVDLVREDHGRDFFEFRFPDTDRGIQQMMLALSVPDHVNVEVIFEHYDTAITNGSSFDAATEKGLAMYDQATRLLDRLQDPVYLSEVNRQLCERFFRRNVEAVCLALAKHDDRAAMDAMLDLGFLNADNIYAVIERIGAVQDATITNYLLEARRQRFEQSVFDDFDL